MKNAPSSAPARPWLTTVWLAAAAAMNYGDRAVIASVLPEIQRDLALTDTVLGLLGATFLWSYAAASPWAGMASDRFRRKSVLIGSLAGWSAVMFATGFAHSLPGLLALRVALGITESFFIPAAFSLIAALHASTTRARALSIVVLGMSVGVVVGGTLAGTLAGHWGWRCPFVVFGLAGLLLSVVFAGVLAEPADSAGPEKESARVWPALGYIVRTPSYLMILLKVMLAGVALWIFSNWLPYYFHETFHLNLGEAGFAGTFLIEFSAVLGLAAGAWLSDRACRNELRQRMLLQATAYVACAPFILLIALQPGMVLVSVALFGSGFLRAAGDANEASIVSEVIPAQFRATAYGLSNMCATAAGGVGVVVAGYFKQALGFPVIFGGCAALLLLAGLFLAWGYRAFLGADIVRARES